MKLEINECPRHGFLMIAVSDGVTGRRVTPGKCCGQWHVVREFRLSADDWRELAQLATKAAERTEAAVATEEA